MGAAGSGGAGLDITDVFSTFLYTGDNGAGSTVQHIKNNIPLSNFGTGGSSVNFDGDDYLTRADFTNNADGKTLTFSAWILFNDFENNYVFSSDTNGGGNGINLGYRQGKLRFFAYNAAGSIVSQWYVDDSNTPFHQWFHLCFSVDTNSGTSATKVYINDVAATTEALSNSNQDIDFTRTVQRLGARTTDYKLTGNLAHVYLDYTYRNLDTESNRRLFIDANGGSTDPSTLSALNPIMYCPLTSNYSMGKNLGTGGDFTTSGNPAFSTLGTEATADTSEGGMVWIKNRDTTDTHLIFDTERGEEKYLASHQLYGEITYTDSLTKFLANGFFVGDNPTTNTSNENYVSWTWRKAPKFFDVQTWTGNGSAGREIPHNLGSVPGVIMVKRTDGGQSTSSHWMVYHRKLDASSPEDKYIRLSGNNPVQDASTATAWNDTAPTATEFTIGNSSLVNGPSAQSAKYVAYLFAHNDGDGEFGPDGDQDIIKCGSFTSGTDGYAVVDLGWEPQWIIMKRTDDTGNWVIYDTMRGWVNSVSTADDAYLLANFNNAEGLLAAGEPNSTGFRMRDSTGSGRNYIYMAIRRGPLAPPEAATEVFAINEATAATGEQTLHLTFL